MLKCTPGSNSSAGIQAKHFLWKTKTIRNCGCLDCLTVTIMGLSLRFFRERTTTRNLNIHAHNCLHCNSVKSKPLTSCYKGWGLYCIHYAKPCRWGAFIILCVYIAQFIILLYIITIMSIKSIMGGHSLGRRRPAKLAYSLL